MAVQRPFVVAFVCAVAWGILPSCSEDPEPVCDAKVDRACTPSYEPTYDSLFTKVLRPSCALAGPSCHSATGAKLGLVFEDADASHRFLVDRRLVDVDRPECSTLARRVTSTNRSFQMPPGLALSPDDQCAIMQWMIRGAAR